MTATTIFDAAIKIMDEQSDTGESIWSDTEEYRHRAIAILNILAGECYPFSAGTKLKPGQRAVPAYIESLEDDVDLDDILCLTVLPYGLAAHLAIDDNPRTASYCQQRYEDLLNNKFRNVPASWEVGEDIYGIQHTEYGRW